MTPEVLEAIKWLLLLVLGYFILPLKKKVDKNREDLVEIKTHYEHISKDLEEIKEHLKELNGKVK